MDGVPVVCFLHADQKILLAIRLQIDEGYDEASLDIKPQTSWIIPAISAASVNVTRPRCGYILITFPKILVILF